MNIRLFAAFSLLLSATLWLACHSSQPAARPPAKRPPTPAPAARPKPAPASGGGIAWLQSERLMPVLEEAQRQKKPVFVEFYASWCAPCKVMEEEVFVHPEAYEYVNRHFLAFRTDFDSPSGRTIAEIYEVKTLPTVLFLNPQGVVLQRKTGMLTLTSLRSMGDAALR